MSNPVRQYSTVRRSRSKILQSLHQYLLDAFQSSMGSITGRQNLHNGDEIRIKNNGGKYWFEVELNSLESDSWVTQLLQKSVVNSIEQ